jgi:AcrR family transcriptional regulator
MPRTKAIDDQAVLDAAFRAIGRHGPAALTLADVAVEVGLSPATLVQRFGSKRGLLLALAGRGADRAGAVLDGAAARHGSPVVALIEGLVTMGAAVESPETMANHLAFLQLDLSDPDFHELAVAHARGLRKAIRALLDSAVSAGELADTDTASLARRVQVVYNGALVTWAVYRSGRLSTWLRRELEGAVAPHLRARR